MPYLVAVKYSLCMTKKTTYAHGTPEINNWGSQTHKISLNYDNQFLRTDQYKS